MIKKFWQGGAGSKILQKPKQAIRKTLRAVQGESAKQGAWLKNFPQYLSALEPGLRLLDQNFPIREGHSRIDYVAVNPQNQITFLWAKPQCHNDTLCRLLPDFDWIQKNEALWMHLFPQFAKNRYLMTRMWIVAREIDPQVKFLLDRLHDIRIGLFQSRKGPEKNAWTFSSWQETAESARAPVPPSQEIPKSNERPKIDPSTALLSREEINDFIHLVPTPESEMPSETEVTDPFYEPGL